MGRMRLGALILSAGLLASTAPAEAGARSEPRVETQSYITNGLWISGHGNLAGQDRHMTIPEDSAPFVFDPAPEDRSVRLDFEDEAGLWPAVVVHQRGSGRRHLDEVQFCAPSRELELHSSKPLEIRVYTGFCLNHTYGVATTGTVTATFNP